MNLNSKMTYIPTLSRIYVMRKLQTNYRAAARVTCTAVGWLSIVFLTACNVDATESVISFSTFVGTAGIDYGSAVALDGEGNIYLTGSVRTSANPVQSTNTDNHDIYVAKLSADGAELIYKTYVGGSGTDYANDICVDDQGNVYLTGATRSADFPLLGAVQAQKNGGVDAFLVQLNTEGVLSYATYLGGRNSEEGFAIACDGSGNAYITGKTNSIDFPLLNPLQPDFNPNGFESFVTKINVTGSVLVYSTYLGGALSDQGQGIAIDNEGSAFVTGATGSPDFPTVNPFQTAKQGLSPSSPDAYIAKLSADGSELVYSSYLGGNRADSGNGVAVDLFGNAIVVGSTFSPDFPSVNAYQSAPAGKLEAFIVKVNRNGAGMRYATVIGGSGSDAANDVVVDSSGNAVVTGSTNSAGFPVVAPIQNGYAGGSRDAFVLSMNVSGSELLFSSLFGGGMFDEGVGVAVDGKNQIVATGRTTSAAMNMIKPLQPKYAGGSFDAFLVKIEQSLCVDNKKHLSCKK